MPEPTFYESLGVPKDASPDQIRRAYREIVFRDHPDKAQADPEALLRYKRAVEAYKTLSDPEKRAAYNRGFKPIAEIKDFRRYEVGRKRAELYLPVAPAAPQRGPDVGMKITVSADLLRLGGTVSVPHKDGAIALPVPADSFERRVCVLPKLGAPGANGADNGDLYVFLVTKDETKGIGE